MSFLGIGVARPLPSWGQSRGGGTERAQRLPQPLVVDPFPLRFWGFDTARVFNFWGWGLREPARPQEGRSSRQACSPKLPLAGGPSGLADGNIFGGTPQGPMNVEGSRSVYVPVRHLDLGGPGRPALTRVSTEAKSKADCLMPRTRTPDLRGPWRVARPRTAAGSSGTPREVMEAVQGRGVPEDAPGLRARPAVAARRDRTNWAHVDRARDHAAAHRRQDGT